MAGLGFGWMSANVPMVQWFPMIWEAISSVSCGMVSFGIVYILVLLEDTVSQPRWLFKEQRGG